MHDKIIDLLHEHTVSIVEVNGQFVSNTYARGWLRHVWRENL